MYDMKLFKRAATFCMAAAMALSLSVTAFADQGDVVANGSLTVTGDQLAGKEVTAIRMFTARATEGSTSTDFVFDTYELEEAWLSFFQSADNISEAEWKAAGVIKDSEAVGNITDYAAAAVTYVQSLTDGETGSAAAFAEKAQDWAVDTGHKESFAALTTTQTASQVEDTTTGSTTFSGLAAGYYLVFPEGGGTGNSNRATDAMLINIPTNEPNATWNIKSTYPTVEKQVNTGSGAADNGSAQVGDVVTFTLTSAVPDMSDYTTFYFAFNDTLSNGLKVVNNAGQGVADGTDITLDSLTVTIDGKTVTHGYTVKLNSNVLKIEFTDLKTATLAEGSITTDDAIVVTYKAMITEDAVTTNPVLNTVKVEYSNDPTTTTTGESTTDESKVYTYDIDVNKWAAGPDGQENTEDDIANLAGAEFVLSTSATLTNGENDTSVIKLINTDSGTGNAYRVAKPGEDDAVTSFTTTATGDITIAGLKVGTYYLHEIDAPAGYNKLKNPIKIVISVTESDYENATITVDGQSASGDGTVVDVENKKGITLPETGSIGTIGLTVAGVAIVLLGVFAPRKKKKDDQE